MTSLEQAALRVIEYYCKNSFYHQLNNHEIKLKEGFGDLRSDPVIEVLSIKAKSDNWLHAGHFGETPWVDVDLNIVDRAGTRFFIPPTILGDYYTRALVEYTSGFDSVPDPVMQAASLLVKNIGEGVKSTASSLMPFITPDIVDLIAPYKTI